MAQLGQGIKSDADIRSELGNLSLSSGMNKEKPRVHEIGQPHVMIGLSEDDARLQWWLRCDGKNGPGRLVAKKTNDPFVVGREVDELSPHFEESLLKDARDVFGGGAVKKNVWRRRKTRRLYKSDAVAINGANSSVADFESVHVRNGGSDHRFVEQRPFDPRKADGDDQVFEAGPAFVVEFEIEPSGIMAQGKGHGADESPLVHFATHRRSFRNGQ